MRYGLEIDDLPIKFDGCGCKLTVAHALQCKEGGLVLGKYNEIRDELVALSIIATRPNIVRNKPIIKLGGDSATTRVTVFANI